MADEQTGNLVSATGAEIMKVMGELSCGGVTVLMVTHDADVSASAHRILHMRDGRILEEKEGIEISFTNIIRTAFLGVIANKLWAASTTLDGKIMVLCQYYALACTHSCNQLKSVYR